MGLKGLTEALDRVAETQSSFLWRKAPVTIQWHVFRVEGQRKGGLLPYQQC